MKSKADNDASQCLASSSSESHEQSTGLPQNNPRHFSFFSKENDDLRNVLQFIESKAGANISGKVCVVSVIGRSVMHCINSKASLVGNIIGQNIFLPQVSPKTCLYEGNCVQIDGYYDTNNRIIFLHLTSILDSWSLINICQDVQKQILEKGFLNQWPNLLIDLLKSLILIFHTSHVVIVSSQTPRFDISCINMFRIVDSLRVKLQPFVSEMLQSIPGLPSYWIKSGRTCVPQLLFVFEAYAGFEYINNSNVHLYSKQLEDQIIRVLRKSRLISTMNVNSLFTLPSTSPFVFISTQNSSLGDYNNFFFQRIFDRCRLDKFEEDNFMSKYYSTNKCNQMFASFLLPHLNAILSSANDLSNAKPHNVPSNELVKSSNLINVLIAFKELIFAQTYPSISAEKSRNLQKIFDSLYSTLDIDNRFSEGRCNKMVKSAISYYQENLPSHYTRETHERKLGHTLQYFTMNSRGPAIYKYMKSIQSECDKIWNLGRKMCEELSLTGNYCLHKLHRLPHAEDHTENNNLDGDSETSPKNLPIMLHASMAKILSACNCGRRQGNREDPFSAKAANYDFYLKMKFKCHTCRHISHMKFSVYDNYENLENLSSSQNMTFKSENRDSPNMKDLCEPAFSPDEPCDDYTAKSELDPDDTQPQEALSEENLSNNDDDEENNNDEDYIVTCRSAPQPGKSDSCVKEEEEEEEEEEEKDALSSDKEPEALKHDPLFLTQSSDNDNDFGEKQFFAEDFNSDPDMNHSSGSNKPVNNFDISTLPPMIHTMCLPNTPARFSSWSLVCLGSSSIYSHNLGIQDQQGFIPGAHYLLPWNVTVMLQHARNMPPLWEGKRPPGIKHKKTLKDGTQFTVKIFIGVEYECLRGHRFIACGPDQMLKTNSNIFPETANKISNNDMPLYMHCICSRSGKAPSLAQLMRIHIVTPKAPIHVTLNPYVQMTPSAVPLFYPGNSEPINLSQSSYWVLRLPMIYEADSGPFCWPKEPFSYCRLLKGCYGIADQVTKVKL